MKSKIEKMKMGNLSKGLIARKLNEIIDHLNSQDQEEEINQYEEITKEYADAFVKAEEKRKDKIAMETYKQATQDTTEEFSQKELELIHTLIRTSTMWGTGNGSTARLNNLLESVERKLNKLNK